MKHVSYGSFIHFSEDDEGGVLADVNTPSGRQTVHLGLYEAERLGTELLKLVGRIDPLSRENGAEAASAETPVREARN